MQNYNPKLTEYITMDILSRRTKKFMTGIEVKKAMGQYGCDLTAEYIANILFKRYSAGKLLRSYSDEHSQYSYLVWRKRPSEEELLRDILDYLYSRQMPRDTTDEHCIALQLMLKYLEQTQIGRVWISISRLLKQLCSEDRVVRNASTRNFRLTPGEWLLQTEKRQKL